MGEELDDAIGRLKASLRENRKFMAELRAVKRMGPFRRWLWRMRQWVR
jgi:hypothetical protein